MSISGSICVATLGSLAVSGVVNMRAVRVAFLNAAAFALVCGAGVAVGGSGSAGLDMTACGAALVAACGPSSHRSTYLYSIPSSAIAWPSPNWIWSPSCRGCCPCLSLRKSAPLR